MGEAQGGVEEAGDPGAGRRAGQVGPAGAVGVGGGGYVVGGQRGRRRDWLAPRRSRPAVSGMGRELKA